MTDQVELVQNAAGRMVPAMVNGKPAIPYLGVGKYQPRGRKAAPPVRSSKDYPEGGDKRVADLETALRKCGRYVPPNAPCQYAQLHWPR